MIQPPPRLRRNKLLLLLLLHLQNLLEGKKQLLFLLQSLLLPPLLPHWILLRKQCFPVALLLWKEQMFTMLNCQKLREERKSQLFYLFNLFLFQRKEGRPNLTTSSLELGRMALLVMLKF
jgi:hypothetical protein